MTEIPDESLANCAEGSMGQNIDPAPRLSPAPTNPDPAGSPVSKDASSSHGCPVMLPTPLSQVEIRKYYYGLPSSPPLVARTGTTPWEGPVGPEGHLKPKELRPVYNHPLQKFWSTDVAPKMIQLLDSKKVLWNSLDVLRIGYVGETHAPVIVWIGVLPGTLSGFDGRDAALQCREVLVERNILDIDVEIRESIVT